ncbi:MAG TPA: hypothetical protein VFO86_10985 [Terriglobia bacterium]|nr:hypothetical protein [Terriglobia bacterium]
MFATLINDAHVIDGGELVKEDLLDALAGVPFAITRLSFREGDVMNPVTKEYGPYVSVELVVADAPMLIRRRVDLSTLPFDPEDTLIFNDGSTGIYRQMVEYLNGAEYVSVVEHQELLVRGGKKGESSFDLPPHKWHDIHRGELEFAESGFGNYSVELSPAVFCKRGIRISDGYENEFTKDGKTRYIA